MLMLPHSLGLIATVTSGIRLAYLHAIGISRNSTWDFSAVVIWSAAEMYVCLICACLPAAKAAGDHVLKHWWDNTGPSIKHLLCKAKPPHLRLPKLWPTTCSGAQELHTSATSQSAITARTSVTVSTMQEDHEKGFPDLPEWEVGVDGGTRSGRLCMTIVEGNSHRQESIPGAGPFDDREVC